MAHTASSPVETPLAGLVSEDADLVVAPAGHDATARAAVAALPRATTVNDADGDKLFDTLEARYLEARAAGTPDPALRTIVVFRDSVATEDGLREARAALPMLDPVVTFHIIPGFSADLTASQARDLASLEAVRQVQWSHPGSPELETARHFTGAEAAWSDYGFDGDRDGEPGDFSADDVVILVSDTGFDSEHQDLPPHKFLAFLDMGEESDDDPYESGSHGTHVASIASGLGAADGKYRGVAPGAALVGAKITPACSGGTSLLITSYGRTCQEGPGAHELAIKALEWAVETQNDTSVDITTISFGFGIATDGTDALELAMDKAWDAGLVNFKSTGNSGPEPGTMTVPAAARGILATGAMRDPSGSPDEPANGFQLASFSSRGPTTDGRVKPDLAAPGVAVSAARAGTTDEYVAFSGTSMASPFAAGTAALVLDANPALTPDEVRQVLFESSRDWGAIGPDNEYGNGRIDVLRAVEYAAYLADDTFRRTATAPVVPGHQNLEIHLDIQGVGSETFEVEDAGTPLSATLIAMETPSDGALWLVNAQVVGPEGQRTDIDHVRTLAKFPGRHIVINILPTEEGEHRLEILGEPNTVVSVDISAGIALPELLELVPEGDAEALGDPLAQESPGVGPAMLLASLAMVGIVAASLRRD